MRLNGLGLRRATLLRIGVYVIALYLESPSRDAAAILDSDTRKAWAEGFDPGARGRGPRLEMVCSHRNG